MNLRATGQDLRWRSTLITTGAEKGAASKLTDVKDALLCLSSVASDMEVLRRLALSPFCLLVKRATFFFFSPPPSLAAESTRAGADISALARPSATLSTTGERAPPMIPPEASSLSLFSSPPSPSPSFPPDVRLGSVEPLRLPLLKREGVRGSRKVISNEGIEPPAMNASRLRAFPLPLPTWSKDTPLPRSPPKPLSLLPLAALSGLRSA
mmetsp:Transcript_40588/g.105360  ORF Transcript_40588/g.105360 Transcript_40588/m.105360 type:complete len:210 (-) Transcript_40588:2864-3493(-)